MPIRSIDYQVMIPKATEVQKIKQVEMQNSENNSIINMHKQQEQNQRTLKKVNETKKAFDSKIKREQPRKQQKNNNQKENEQKDRKNKNKTTIDIRI